ncbi:MAG: F420-dependent NADP oxidoreductase [Bacteroidales bacterium]|nr:F420-dependent NADP oxidoreductase [Bacteroidales bacterium]
MDVVIIGAGNVGTHFAKALQMAGANIIQVFSRTMKSAVELASEVSSSFTTDIQNVTQNADLYLLCVNDSTISPIIKQLQIGEKLIVHTSGCVGIDVFEGYALNYGCVYPVQSFSKFKDLNYNEIPVFVEANNDENQQVLIDLMRLITPHVQILSSQQRKYLHLSAVLLNNFTNHLCTLSEMMMKENQLQFDLLKPLLKETFEKIVKYSPYEAQTGPAVRGDEFILQKHRELLENHRDILEIYNAISYSIKKTHTK